MAIRLLNSGRMSIRLRCGWALLWISEMRLESPTTFKVYVACCKEVAVGGEKVVCSSKAKRATMATSHHWHWPLLWPVGCSHHSFCFGITCCWAADHVLKIFLEILMLKSSRHKWTTHWRKQNCSKTGHFSLASSVLKDGNLPWLTDNVSVRAVLCSKEVQIEKHRCLRRLLHYKTKFAEYSATNK